MKRGTSVIDRIMDRIEIDSDTECWLWPGAKVGGYGRVRITGSKTEKILTHRATYEHFVGPIPEGCELDHKCRTPACCNPDHVEPVTHAENMARGYWASRTHCKNGHEYTPENTYYNPSGCGRSCRTCVAAAQARMKRRREQNS